MNQEYVGAAAPVAPWMGGKSKLAKTIIERIEVIEHSSYIEPFVGMGGVFLRRRYRPKSEIVNDINGEIINLFRILQIHYPQFMDVLKFQISSRREFERLRKQDPSTLTDLQRAARFIYLQRQTFGGKPNDVFRVESQNYSRFDMSKIGSLLEAAHERLSGVVFENLDWAELIHRYDSPNALFYLDPPYLGNEADYGKGIFDPTQFQKMSRILKELRGDFILSINDCAAIRALFGWAYIDEVRLKYTVSKQASNKIAKELIISSKPAHSGLL